MVNPALVVSIKLNNEGGKLMAGGSTSKSTPIRNSRRPFENCFTVRCRRCSGNCLTKETTCHSSPAFAGLLERIERRENEYRFPAKRLPKIEETGYPMRNEPMPGHNPVLAWIKSRSSLASISNVTMNCTFKTLTSSAECSAFRRENWPVDTGRGRDRIMGRHSDGDATPDIP